MASFFDAATRLVLRRRPGEGRMTDEHAQSLAIRPQLPQVGPAAVPLPQHQPQLPPQPQPQLPPQPQHPLQPQASAVDHHPVYLRPEDDPLTFFRLMLGIQTTPYLGFTITSPIGTRPAPNIGLYARIIHSEQKAKDSFKVFSVVINGCYFLQIVIAAALTALGAARASSGAVTAFGALNTVIAGFLTFLKGSGLPGRLKYYGNEWKKIREFIEQRERDFMRSGHNLDVYEVIETVEKMYNNLKADIELNTPDSYTSLTNQRRTTDDKDKIGGIDMSKIESLATKLKGFDKLDSLTSGLAKKTEGFTKSVNQHEKELEDEVDHIKNEVDHAKQDVQSQRARLVQEAKDGEAQARAAIHEGKQAARDGIQGQVAKLDHTVDEHKRNLDRTAGEQQARALAAIDDTGRAAQEGINSTAGHATTSILGLAHEISNIHRTALSDGRAAAAQQIRSLAQRLAGHDHNDDDSKHEERKHEERKPEAKQPEAKQPEK